MEKKTHHSEPEHIGSIIEQWFKRFELIAKETHKPFGLTKGKAYHIRVISFQQRS